MEVKTGYSLNKSEYSYLFVLTQM